MKPRHVVKILRQACSLAGLFSRRPSLYFSGRAGQRHLRESPTHEAFNVQGLKSELM